MWLKILSKKTELQQETTKKRISDDENFNLSDTCTVNKIDTMLKYIDYNARLLALLEEKSEDS